MLLARNANPNLPDNEGDTPLIEAAKSGHLNMVQLLLESDTNADLSNLLRLSALATFGGNDKFRSQIARLLIDKGAQINSQTDNGDTTLILAVRNNLLELTRVLLAKKADPNLPDSKGNTPLIEAVKYGYVNHIKLLLQADANVNALNQENKSALDFAHEIEKDFKKRRIFELFDGML